MKARRRWWTWNRKYKTEGIGARCIEIKLNIWGAIWYNEERGLSTVYGLALYLQTTGSLWSSSRYLEDQLNRLNTRDKSSVSSDPCGAQMHIPLPTTSCSHQGYNWCKQICSADAVANCGTEFQCSRYWLPIPRSQEWTHAYFLKELQSCPRHRRSPNFHMHLRSWALGFKPSLCIK